MSRTAPRLDLLCAVALSLLTVLSRLPFRARMLYNWVTVAYFAFRALKGSETDSWLAAGYLGLAGGLRQSVLLLLFPLWLGATVVGLRRLRTIVIGLAVIAVATLTWFVPMIWLSGGLDRYLAASLELADSVAKPTSILGGPSETTLRISRYVLESVLVGLGPLALAGFLVPWYAGPD